VLGNVANGTLTLRDDAKGLYFECIPPNTQYARDFTESIRRGDVRSCSFMFDCLNDTWSRDKDGTPLRQVKEARLYEVSAVVFPAYPATMVSARSILSNLTQAFEKRTNKAKEELTDEDKEELRAILLSINALLISDDDDEDDDADETEDQTSEPAPEVPETPESDQNFELDSAPNGEQCGVVQIEEQRQLDEIRLFLMSTI
jgi:hypothetical protein